LLSILVLIVLIWFGYSKSNKNNMQKNSSAINYFEDPQDIAVANAVARGEIERIKKLISEGVDANKKGNGGITFTIWAIQHRQKESLKTLLTLGADPNARNDENYPLMEFALGIKDKELMTILLDAKADINIGNYENEPIIFTTIKTRDRDLFKYLVEKGADINSRGINNITPMMLLALVNNDFEMVSWLIDKGADVFALDNQKSDLAWVIQDAEDSLDPKHPIMAWYYKVKAQLEAKGVKFPVIPPWERK
jgi:ankyrin repeat protein